MAKGQYYVTIYCHCMNRRASVEIIIPFEADSIGPKGGMVLKSRMPHIARLEKFHGFMLIAGY